MKCPRRRSSSGWRRQPAAPKRARTTSRRSPRLRVLRSFSNSTRDFSDSLTICNYNLPSTINTWFRLKFCRRKAALIVFTRHSTHSRSPRRCAGCTAHTRPFIRTGAECRIYARLTPPRYRLWVAHYYYYVLCFTCVHCKSTIIRCNFIWRIQPINTCISDGRSARSREERKIWYNSISKRFEFGAAFLIFSFRCWLVVAAFSFLSLIRSASKPTARLPAN